MNLANVLRVLRPGISIPAQCEIVDFGNGPQIVRWSHPSARPSADEIASVSETEATAAGLEPVTRRQMLTALHSAGMLSTIQDAVTASNNVALQIAFNESQEFERNNPLLKQITAALGITDEQINDVFALAATL